MTVLDRTTLEQHFGGQEKLHELSYLSLVGLDITDIACGTFANLPRVTILSISRTKIKRITQEMFCGLENLSRLVLFYNQISEIEPYAFENLPKLENLSLNGNKIETIHRNAFKGLENLQVEIDLSANQISEISVETFEHLGKTIIINLQGNPIASTVLSFSDGLMTKIPAPTTLFCSDWETFLSQFSSSKDSWYFDKYSQSAQKTMEGKNIQRVQPFADTINCPMCSKTLKEPIVFPCGHSICKTHQDERISGRFTSIGCIKCQQLFEIPKTGFAPNRVVEMLLEKSLESIDLGGEFQDASRECSDFADLLAKLKELRADPEMRINEVVSELRRRVDLRREELKAKIDHEALEVIRQLNEYENERRAQVKNIDMTPIDTKIAAWELDIKSWTKQLAGFKRDVQKWKGIFAESSSKREEGKAAYAGFLGQIFSERLHVFENRANSIGTNDLIIGRTINFNVNNLNKKITKLSDDWLGIGLSLRSDLMRLFGIKWTIRVNLKRSMFGQSSEHTSVGVYLEAEFPCNSGHQVWVDFDLKIICGPPDNKEIVSKKKSKGGSNNFALKTQSGFESLYEIKHPVANDPIFCDPKVNSFRVQATIKAIKF